MFIQPKGGERHARSRGKVSGVVLIGFGALIFLYVIQQYTQRIMPSVRMAEAASAYYGYRGGHANLVLASDLDEQEIQNIIAAQIAALKHRDFAAALRCTSINDPQADPDRYETFLATWYPQNATPRSVAFSDSAMLYQDKCAYQRVSVTGQDGSIAEELYMLVRTDVGWRVRHFRVMKYIGSDFVPINP